MPEFFAARRTFFPWLDALRLFAALSVLVFHVTGSDGFVEVPAAWPWNWIRGGWVGLDIFFVISGLVVGQSALAGYAQRGTAFRPEFVRHRLARILPLYLLTLAACAAFLIRPWTSLLGWQALAHVFFVHNLWPQTMMSINAPAWSLGVEVQLYALLLILTPWLSRRGAATVALCCIVLALAYRAAVFTTIHRLDPSNTSLMLHLTYQMPGMADSFGLGVAASLFLNRHDKRFFRPITCVGLMAGGLIGLSAGSVITFQVADGSIWSDPFYAVSMRTGIAVAACALVIGCAQMPDFKTKFLQPIFRRGGELSYGIYLWHFFVLVALQKTTALSGWALVAAVVTITVCLAAATYRFVERPIVRWSKHQRAVRFASDTSAS